MNDTTGQTRPSGNYQEAELIPGQGSAAPKTSAEGRAMGLFDDSVVVTDNLATILHREIDKVIGTCPRMEQVDNALRRTLGL